MKSFTVLLIVSVSMLTLGEWKANVVLDVQAEHRGERGPNISFHNLSSGIRGLEISFNPIRDRTTIITNRDGSKSRLVSMPTTQGTYSELPLGIQSFKYFVGSGPDIGTRSLMFTSEFESGSITASGIPAEILGETNPWVEKLARLSFAKYAAVQRIRAGSNQSVNGRSLAGFTAQKSNVNFVRFADWANARGIQYSYNSAKCTISFTRNGKSILLPIAAKAVRVNGTWRDLPDIVMISPDREERTLVPVALDALTN